MRPKYLGIPDNPEALWAESMPVFTIDMHTAGEPLRVILAGSPTLNATTILEARREMQTHHDAFRTTLMWEPRGHTDMYGALIIPPEREDSLFGVLFMHNAGYSTMCGHATIALGRLAFELGWIDKSEQVNQFKIDAPCGQLECLVYSNALGYRSSGFNNVPSFAPEVDQEVFLNDGSSITYDLGYGGAFYAIVDLAQFDVGFDPANTSFFIDKGLEIKSCVQNQSTALGHPFEHDLSFLYGTIFVDNTGTNGMHSRNVCMFADGEIDRSPTGSGISARAAVLYKKNKLMLGHKLTIGSIINSTMTVELTDALSYGNHPSVTPCVNGTAWMTGVHHFVRERHDPLGDGFLLK